LSTYGGRVGEPFNIDLVYPDEWTNPLVLIEEFQLPMWDVSWTRDYADADNFVRRYMHSGGDFAFFQNYTANNGWTGANAGNKDVLIDEAITALTESTRQVIYGKLQQIYFDDCPSIPVPTSTIRFWCQYWVKGWYYDAMYPGIYVRSLWKADDCWFDVTGPTLGVSDGKTNMRDIAYLILHFNARAPSSTMGPDPKWVGVYGANGCVDSYGDRVCNMRDVSGAVLHFNHKNGTLTP
jgi:hypothetical protein